MLIGPVLKLAEKVYGEVKDRKRKSEEDLRHHKISASVEGLSMEVQALRERCNELNEADVKQTELIKDCLEQNVELASEINRISKTVGAQRALAIATLVACGSMLAAAISVLAVLLLHK